MSLGFSSRIPTAVLFYSQHRSRRARAAKKTRGDGLSVTILEASDSICENEGVMVPLIAARPYLLQSRNRRRWRRDEEAIVFVRLPACLPAYVLSCDEPEQKLPRTATLLLVDKTIRLLFPGTLSINGNVYCSPKGRGSRLRRWRSYCSISPQHLAAIPEPYCVSASSSAISVYRRFLRYCATAPRDLVCRAVES